MNDILELDATALAHATRSGALTAAAVLEAYLSRIEALNPRVDAVLEVNLDARADAARLDALPAEQRGPLHGVPVLLKDNIDTLGPLHTSAGSALLAQHVAAADAPLAARLRAAGALILGKANMTEWANFMTLGMPNGYSSRGGQVVNPWRAGHDTGGSSSGSGAAVAARLAPIAIGTETSGSILSPSHQHGLVGLKPTVGLIPRTGVIPISHSQDTAGPMARTARDAALLAHIMQGPDGQDAATQDAPTLDFLAEMRDDALRGARIGVARTGYWDHLSDAERTTLNASLDALRASGAEVIDPADVDTQQDLAGWLLEVLSYEFKTDLNAYLANVQHGPHSLRDVIDGNDADPDTRLRYGQTLLLASEATRGDLSEPAYARARTRDLDLARTRGLDTTFSRHQLDALVFPKYYGAAIGAKAGYPSVNVPVGLADGVPLGAQLCGPAWSDAKLLSFAHAWTAALGPWQAAPEGDAAP